MSKSDINMNIFAYSTEYQTNLTYLLHLIRCYFLKENNFINLNDKNVSSFLDDELCKKIQDIKSFPDKREFIAYSILMKYGGTFIDENVLITKNIKNAKMMDFLCFQEKAIANKIMKINKGDPMLDEMYKDWIKKDTNEWVEFSSFALNSLKNSFQSDKLLDGSFIYPLNNCNGYGDLPFIYFTDDTICSVHDKYRSIRDFLLSKSLVSELIKNVFPCELLNHYDFIEIGTSDFDTMLETCTDTEKGLSIEPLFMYQMNLPNRENVEKLNVAISDRDGILKVHYIDLADIIKYDMPDWVRGCNSIDNPHPTVVNLLKEMDLPQSLIQTKNVRCMTMETLYYEKKIIGVSYLKIDTEGHDYNILKNLYDFCKNRTFLFPTKIQFESNSLTNEKHINEIIELYEDIGYKVVYSNEVDTLLSREHL